MASPVVEGGVIADAPVKGDASNGSAARNDLGEVVKAAPTTDEKAEAVKIDESSNEAKDKALEKDVESVKAPGLVERTMEEVEAVTEAVQEKLNLKDQDEDALKKNENPGLFQRFLMKLRGLK